MIAANNDLMHLATDGLNATDEVITACKREITTNMALFKEIYIFLQGISPSYPFVDHYTVTKHLLEKAHIDYDQIDRAAYDRIFSKVDYTSRRIPGMV